VPRARYRAAVSEASVVEEKRRRDVPVGVVMVGMSIVVWWPSFTLGAYGEIFFTEMLAVWAAATAAFVFVLIERRPLGGRLLRAFLLLLPSVWLVLTAVVDDEVTDLAIAIVDVVAILAVLIGIPFTLGVLVRVVWPDFAHDTRTRTKWLIAGVVLGVAVISFLIGLNHEHFLTCWDFELSGNWQPENCTPAPTEIPFALR